MGNPRTAGVKKLRNLQDIYRVVEQSPGIRAYRISKMLNRPSGTISSAMASMDLAGLFVSEDEGGFLYPFRISNPRDSQILYMQTRR